MLKKWKQRAIQMNMKKAVTSFVVVSAILMIVSSGTLYVRFGDKINTWEATTEDSRGHGKEESYEISLKGNWILKCLDTLTGEIREMPGNFDGTHTWFEATSDEIDAVGRILR